MPRPGVSVTETTLPVPVTAGNPSAAAGAMLALLPSGPTTPTLVTSWYQFSRVFGPLNRNFPATFAANMFFRAGGRELFVGRIVRSDATAATATILGDGDDAGSTASEPYLTFYAKSSGTYGNSLRVKITANARSLYDVAVFQEAGVAGDIADDTLLESFTNLNLASHGNSEVIDVINVRSQFITVAWGSDVTVDLPSTVPTLSLTGGGDGTSGTLSYVPALTALRQIDRSLVLFSPGLTTSSVVSAMRTFAAETASFVVLDTDPDLTVAQAVAYAGTLAASDRVSVYYPHLWVADSTSASQDSIVKVSPSGAVAGVILSTDASEGVFRAPAGIQATLSGVVAVERNLTNEELDSLNNDNRPVNAIRVMPGAGPVVMGARTLDQSRSTRYTNVRRTLDFLTKEMESALSFALFRNNNTDLWREISTVLDNFLRGFYVDGGLRGATPADAFYIKVDNENNPSSDIASGIVNVEVGVALQYPAEFIKIKLTQRTIA